MGVRPLSLILRVWPITPSRLILRGWLIKACRLFPSPLWGG
jgi:hypothetical protein